MADTPQSRGQKGSPARRVALMGLLFAMAMVLSLVEGMLPALPMLPPGVKLGLSNIVTMYCLFFLGPKDAYTMAVLKALFALLTRNPTAAAMSLTGGLVSVSVMLVLLAFKKLNLSYLVVSVAGAIFHNVGQLCVAWVLLKNSYVFYYLPIMAVSGVAMGVVTGILLRVLLPYMNKLSRT